MRTLCCFTILLSAFPSLVVAQAREARITVHADLVVSRISPYLTGACIEDVNHEIYGGLYSQMIFGESFQEPAASPAFKNFQVYGGTWLARDGVITVKGLDGPKLVNRHAALKNCAIGVDLLFADRNGQNAGLIVRVADPRAGADNFAGYEVSLDPRRQVLVLGRHRNDFQLLKEVRCDVAVRRWIPLEVRLSDSVIEILVDGKSVLHYDDGRNALAAGTVGLRAWFCQASYRNLWVRTGKRMEELPLEQEPADTPEVSGMWRAVQRGTARGQSALISERPFVGVQSQQLSFISGDGEWGVENQGLNRWGMNFVAGKPYEGHAWVRAEKPATLFASLESRDGTQVYAETPVTVSGGDWQRIGFSLTPRVGDKAGRFALKLKQPGSVTLGYAFLQPGEWGRFKGLPVRKDVAEALVAQGLSVLRYGGSMVNSPEYRWKKMIGPRDRRPPHKGTWYPYSTNGWGIFDFLDFCRAAGFLAVPDVNMDEAPQDMADFIEYVNGPADSPWGKRRVADGNPKPYRLKYLELGNEEAVNEDYWRRFKPLAEAIWAKDPAIILLVGDFAYGQAITDPSSFSGAPSIHSLAAHKKILDLARQHGREVWFDVHIGTDFPRDGQGLEGVRSFIEALAKISPEAKHKVVIFEFNAGHHNLGRALGNARATNELQRIGDRVPIACSANCLQPYRQNDNDWDQGLLFLSPSQVWAQPPYYVTQMMSRHYLPNSVRSEVESPKNSLDVTAATDTDGKVLQLQVVNLDNRSLDTEIAISGFVPRKTTIGRVELRGRLDEINTPENPQQIVPRTTDLPHGIVQGKMRYAFPPCSFTILRLE